MSRLINPKKYLVRLSQNRFFYRIFKTLFISLLLLVFTTIFYFLVLISVDYKSFPFISQQIEKMVNKKLPNDNKIKVGKSYIKFSKLSKILVKFDDITLKINDKKDLVLPKIEAEFSIFNLIFGKIIPSQLKIIDPKIEIDNTSQSPKIVLHTASEEAILPQENLQLLSQIFMSAKDGGVAIKNFLILNAKIIIKNAKSEQIILFKEVRIKTYFNHGSLYVEAKNIIGLDNSPANLLINPNCKFANSSGLECSVNFSNFAPATIAFLHPKLSPLQDISAILSGEINVKIDSNYQLEDLSFKIKSSDGNFYYPQFFSKKINFSNLDLEGSLDNSLKNVAIKKLSCNFDKTKFVMSLSAKNFMDTNQQNTLMQFQISNAPTNNLEILWPVFLNQNGIRKWVIEHIKGGMIRDGYATMELQYKDGVEYLTKINSELIFTGLNLEYSLDFPKISNVDGIATFSQNQMKIDIAKGNVLNSKINSATVAIANFNAPVTILEVDGKISGAAEDSLKHIDHKSEFANQINNYFNGEVQTTLAIKLPLIEHINLQDVSIKIDSGIKNFHNEYIAKGSDLNIYTNKEFGNDNFITTIDLTDANINLKQFGINKEKGIKSNVAATISFNQANQISIKDFNWKQSNKDINANLLLRLNPLKLEEIRMKNDNFANSNFNLDYKISNNSRFIKLTGKKLDLRNFIEFEGDYSGDNFKFYPKNDIRIDLGEIDLANNQKFTNVDIDIHCRLADCKNGFIKSNLGHNKDVDIAILSPKNDKQSSIISGTIDDISLIAKAFNLSNQIIGGKAKIMAEILANGYLQGELKIDSGFTILKNEVVEKISKNNIFGGLKDKILTSNEIQFDNLKLEFLLKNDNLDIKTLIAGSYLMGFTAKGNVDFSNNKIVLKGLIVPGYVLNRIFGIGQIPIVGKLIVGEEGGGIFAVRYDYIKEKDNQGDFSINPVSAIIPGGIRNIFNLLD